MFNILKTVFSFAPIALALLPLSHAAQIQVTVGGPGVLKYNPQFVVRIPLSISCCLSYLIVSG